MPVLYPLRRLARPVSLCCLLAPAPALAATGVATIPEITVSAKDAPGGRVTNVAAKTQDWDAAVKDATRFDGLFPLYKKKESVLAAVPTEWMRKPFLGVMTYGSGIGAAGILGGLPLGTRVLEWQRVDDHVLLVEKNMRVVAPENTAYSRSLELSYGNSVLASLPVISVRDSDQAVLVDLTPVLLSDFTNLSEIMKNGLDGRAPRFDRERSSWGTIRTFPENLEIDTQLTYDPSDPSSLSLGTVPDARYLTVTVHYSLSRLPPVPMTPRLADDRVGYFLTARKDFGRDQQEDYWVRMINRRRLISSDPGAALAEPVKPIVFYLDRTIPPAYRPAIVRGVENWQKAFEAAGFKDAIVARDAPDDSTFDPADVRYSTIRWIVSSEASFGAIAPSRIDPRSGEILDSDILIEGSVIQNFGNTWRRYASAQALGEAVLPQAPAMAGMPLEQQCVAAAAFADGGALLRLDLLAAGALTAGHPVPASYVDEALTQMVMHEVGHTLGLRHNFRSSTATPFDKLSDTLWTRAHGLTGSVMDYATPNIGTDPLRQGDYYSRTVGDYDVWAIRYGYAMSGTKELAADYVFAGGIASASLDPGHQYSTDEDTYPSTAPDPRSNLFDLGDDPLRFAQSRLTLISSLWQGGTLENKLVQPGASLTAMRRAMDSLLGQYATALGLAVKYVGGGYVSRVHRGQAGYVDPVRPVPARQQRAALDFLSQRAFAARAFTVSPGLLNQLAPDSWRHWGMERALEASDGRVEYNWNDRVSAIQSGLLDALLSPPLLARLHELESRAPAPMTLAEFMNRLTTMMWGEVGATPAMPRTLAALERATARRETQLAYIDRMSSYVTGSSVALPEDARSLARLQLQRIDARCARAQRTGATLGEYTRAHLAETRARIQRALAAQKTIGGGGGFFQVIRNPAGTDGGTP